MEENDNLNTVLHPSFFSSNSNDSYDHYVTWEEVLDRSFKSIREDWDKILMVLNTISAVDGNYLKELQDSGENLSAEDYKTVRIADALIFKICLKQALEEYYPYDREEFEIYSSAVYYGQNTSLVAWGLAFRCLNPRAAAYGHICTLVCKFNKPYQAFTSIGGLGILPAHRNAKILNKIIIRAFSICPAPSGVSIITRDSSLGTPYCEKVKKKFQIVKELIFHAMDFADGVEIPRKKLFGEPLKFSAYLYEMREWIDY